MLWVAWFVMCVSCRSKYYERKEWGLFAQKKSSEEGKFNCEHANEKCLQMKKNRNAVWKNRTPSLTWFLMERTDLHYDTIHASNTCTKWIWCRTFPPCLQKRNHSQNPWPLRTTTFPSTSSTSKLHTCPPPGLKIRSFWNRKPSSRREEKIPQLSLKGLSTLGYRLRDRREGKKAPMDESNQARVGFEMGKMIQLRFVDVTLAHKNLGRRRGTVDARKNGETGQWQGEVVPHLEVLRGVGQLAKAGAGCRGSTPLSPNWKGGMSKKKVDI